MPATPPFHDTDFWAGDPYPAFAELRREDPVHRYDGEAGGFWAITRHADVQAVSKDPATFCSGQGVLLTDLTRPVLSTDSILYLDPPLHSKRRKLVSPSLTVRRVADLEDRIRSIVTELLDELPTGEVVDAVEVLSMPLPLMVIAELVGVPRSDLADFRRWSDAMIEAASDFTDEALALAAELFVYIDAIVQARHTAARDDLVSVLAHGSVDGEAVSDEDINMFVLTLLVAGNETTRTLISNSLVALDAHPDQRQLLVEDPARLPVGGGGAAAVGGADHELLPHGDARHEPVRHRHRRGRLRAALLPVGQPRRGRRSARRPTGSTSPAPRTRTCPSATRSTTASARGWPGSRRGCCSRSYWRGGPATRSPGRSSGSRAAWRGASATSRSCCRRSWLQWTAVMTAAGTHMRTAAPPRVSASR